jgi:hypothetical protein
MNCSYFYDFLGAVLWDLINQGSKFIPKKIVTGPRAASTANIKKITADPTPDNGDPGSLTIFSLTLAHSSALAGEPCAGCSKFPTYIYYSAHEIQIAA